MAIKSMRKLLAPSRDDVRPEDLAALAGECSATIVEMKRRARCETDLELANFLHKNRTAVAQWRRRGTVPESAILRLLILCEGAEVA